MRWRELWEDRWMKLIAAVALVACVDKGGGEKVAELEARIAKLEKGGAVAERVDQLQRNLDLELSRFRDPSTASLTIRPPVRVVPSPNSWWWCVTGGRESDCVPESPTNPPDRFVKNEGYGVIFGWDSRGSMYAAELCNRKAREAGGACVSTRYVVCATHDADTNVCFATWAECQAHLELAAKLNPNGARRPRECAAYFSGSRLE